MIDLCVHPDCHLLGVQARASLSASPSVSFSKAGRVRVSLLMVLAEGFTEITGVEGLYTVPGS